LNIDCQVEVPYWRMSERSIYLRDQADKLSWHARRIMDAETEAQLRKMAAEYSERAAEIESKERE
jgi:UTP:GlnB (protein PII) uridylyltransferase